MLKTLVGEGVLVAENIFYYSEAVLTLLRFTMLEALIDEGVLVREKILYSCEIYSV